MNDFNSIFGIVDGKTEQQIDENIEVMPQANPFDIGLFLDELYDNSEKKNREYNLKFAKNINAYDLTTNCIGQVIYKLQKTPVRSFADKWLPILMRGVIGNAVHDFIQSNTKQFTELERVLKVPSIRFSGRLDGLVGWNVLSEIKSCPYSDYRKIIKTQKPRASDFFQVIIYRYMLHHYLEEIQSLKLRKKASYKPPSLKKYNINKIQFIYVAHDLVADDTEDFSVALKKIAMLKKQLTSRTNKFFFITSLVIDINDEIAKPFEDRMLGKLKRINEYVETNRFPTINDPYVDKTKCFFCLYKEICQI